MIELNERLPDAGKLLPPAGTPVLFEGRRRSLREWAADRRAARSQLQAGPPDVVDRSRWRTAVAPPRAVDPATWGRLQDAVRALGEEADANQAELEQRAAGYDDPGCPPDLFGPDEPSATERHHNHDGRYNEPPLEEKLAADDIGGMTDRAAHARSGVRPTGSSRPTPDRDRLERDERDDR